eukprot:CAMPEP_0170562470 /NCGR_PEP_ID=MMETSP0211-20121228/60716_1 /TAXON_ID=311385 /ORGANISM="Pseudokeronopsis sp., Strain OXSARD2" /LENGTH=51 /DNA_ID=CAMNT_0010879391 /DNA_START=170 /DNA_END=321 /DNA_ORIENTATION=-
MDQHLPVLYCLYQSSFVVNNHPASSLQGSLHVGDADYFIVEDIGHLIFRVV